MIRLKSLAPALAGLLLFGSAARADQSVTDVIPADAAGAVAVKSLDDFGAKLDKLAVDSAIPNPLMFAPSQFLNLGLAGQLNITKGMDSKAPFAVVLPNLNKVGFAPGEDPKKSLVFVVPATTIDELASNFGFKDGELKPGAPIEKEGKFYGVRGKHVLIGGSAKSVAAVADSKPLSGSVSAAQKASADKSDLYLHVDADGAGDIWAQTLGMAEDQLASRVPGPQGEQLKKLFAIAKSTKYASAGFRLDDGLGLTLRAAPRAGGELAKILSQYGDGSSNLAGLPVVQPLFALAQAGKSSLNDPAEIRKAIKNALEQNPRVRDVLSEEDENKLLDAAETASKHVKGIKAVAYRTANAAEADKTGLFGFTVIVDTDDADAVLSQLAPVAAVLNSMIDKQAPGAAKFEYLPKAETLGGARVDVLKISLHDQAKDQADAKAKPVLGPDWNKIRMGVEGNTVVVQVGTDLETLKSALANVKSGAKGLAGNKAVVGAESRLDAKRQSEIHVSVRNIISLALGIQAGDPAVALPAVEALTSMAFGAGPDAAQMELFIPTSEIKAIVQAATQKKGAPAVN